MYAHTGPLKVGGGGGGVVAHKILVSAPVPLVPYCSEMHHVHTLTSK